MFPIAFKQERFLYAKRKAEHCVQSHAASKGFLTMLTAQLMASNDSANNSYY